MKKTITILALAVLASMPFRSEVFAADAAKDRIDAFDEKMKDADEATKVTLIEQLARDLPDNPDASKAISKFVTDRSTAVKVAAIKALGTYKDKRHFGLLMSIMKRSEDDPKVLEAALLAVGAYGDRHAKKEIIDIARKFLKRDSAVTQAAARALGKIPDRESVDELIKLLDLTYPRQSPNGPAVSQETRKLCAESRPAIMEALKELTGWDFESARAWASFWDKNKKTWKPGGKEVDLTKVTTWTDPGYGFEITNPGAPWVFSKADNVRINLSRGEEGVTQASVYVNAYDMSQFQSMTAEQKAQSYEDNYRPGSGKSMAYKDIKEDSWVREPMKVGKEKGFLQEFTGQSGSGAILHVRNIFVVHNENMYIIGSWVRSGAPKEVDKQVQKAMDSFRFLD